MAYTAHSDPEQLVERYDSDEDLAKLSLELALRIKSAQHFIAFTGAGISTSANIPDFRGPQGVWTLAATGGKRTEPTTSVLKALPTPTHMALVKLHEKGYLKHIVSQNCDGLFRKSGLAPEAISELHGNTNIEQCTQCGKEYLRDFDATASYQFSNRDHRTGRCCVLCGGVLVDSIINFGEDLPEDVLKTAFDNASQSDFCLVLGSSLTVTPACKIPEKVGKQATLAICNLQKTPYDRLSKLRIFAPCDRLMQLVMHHLGLEIDPWLLNRHICSMVNREKRTLTISAFEIDATPASIFPGILVEGKKLEEEPFVYTFPSGSESLQAKLFFFGHYNEPMLPLMVDCTQEGPTYFHLKYNPMTGDWIVTPKGSDPGFSERKLRPPRKQQAAYSRPAKVVPGNKQGGFGVHPISNCPHLGAALSVGMVEIVASAFNRINVLLVMMAPKIGCVSRVETLIVAGT